MYKESKEQKDENKLLAQHSRALLPVLRVDFSANELKLFYTYLGLINSADPESRKIRLTVDELKEILGVSKIVKSQLENNVENLRTSCIDVEYDNYKYKLNLFSAVGMENEEDVGTICLCCSQDAFPFIFNLNASKIPYFKFWSSDITKFRSVNTIKMYVYLQSNKFRKSWTVGLEELKEWIGVEGNYSEFKDLNKWVLKHAQNEIHSKSNTRYKYEPIRVCRSIKKIRFTILNDDEEMIECISSQPQLPSNSENEECDYSELDYGSELANLLAETCDYEFNKEQIRVLQDLILKVCGPGMDELDKSDYLTQQLNKMNLYASQKEIKNRFAYLCRMIEKDRTEEWRDNDAKKTSDTDHNDSSYYDDFTVLGG